MDARLQLTGTPGAATSPPAITAWRVGQVLDATVVRDGTAQQGDARTVIRIGGRDYAVQADHPLPAGENLKLRVLASGPRPVLQLLQAVTGDAPETPPSIDLHISLLNQRTRLPAGLSELARRVAEQPDPALRNEVRTLLDRLPGPETLTSADGVRRSVAAAGHHLEAGLAAGVAPHPADHKAALFRLLDTLTRAESMPLSTGNAGDPVDGLKQAVTGLVNQIALNQLQSHATPNGQHWVIELPFRYGDHFDAVHVELDTERNAGEATHETVDWSVRLRLDLPGLGPLVVHLQSREAAVSGHFRAEQAATAHRINAHLPELAAAWQRAGLFPGALSCEHQPPASTDTEEPSRPAERVDTRA
jgi:hypothetical protein